MSETSDGKTKPILGSAWEDEWLEKAVKDLENGMNITVNYLGKIELAKSLSEEPDADKRLDIVVGLLRVIAKEATVLQDPAIPDVTNSFLLNSKIRAKPPRLAALSISLKGFGLALVDESVAAPFLGWHSVSEVAFAHVDPEHENIVGYYAAKKTTGKRFCYAIETNTAAHILACMKLAFTMVEQQKTGKVDLRSVAEAMTPSPTTPSKDGTYSLVRFAVPEERRPNRGSSSRTAASRRFKEDDDDDVKNIYLNVMLPAPPKNPYHVHHVYRGVSNLFGGNKHKKTTIEEKIVEQSPNGSEEEEIRQAPPIMKKSEKVRKAMEKIKKKVAKENRNLPEAQESSKVKKTKSAIYTEVYLGPAEAKKETAQPKPKSPAKPPPQDKPRPRPPPPPPQQQPQSESKPPAKPPLQQKPRPKPPPPSPQQKSESKPLPSEQEPRLESKSPAKALPQEKPRPKPPSSQQEPQSKSPSVSPVPMKPKISRRVDIRTAVTDPDREIPSPLDRDPLLRQKLERQRILERYRFESLARPANDLPPPLQPRRQKPFFREFRNTLKQKTLRVLRMKMGNLRAKYEDDSNVSQKSEYSSLNSGSFHGSISEVSDDDSMDSGVMEDDFFVFPEEDQSKVETNCFPKLVTPHFQLEISLIRFLKLAEYLDEQPWFHGTIRRQIAECRLVKDGEFLIRQSITQPGQFILSVLQNRSVRHICLVSANGTIRSYGYEFGSVIQLIQFHFHNRVPMCSTRTAVLLEIPVARP